MENKAIINKYRRVIHSEKGRCRQIIGGLIVTVGVFWLLKIFGWIHQIADWSFLFFPSALIVFGLFITFHSVRRRKGQNTNVDVSPIADHKLVSH